MATIAPTKSRLAPDTGFFLTMAIVMAALNVLAFTFFMLMGISSFGAPLYVHVHAFVFFGWVVLYVAQNVLVATGSTTLHRKLGWLAAGWTLVMVVVGTLTTAYTVQRGLTPPIFTPSYFLVMNPVNILVFAILVLGGVAVRANTGWHRRLIYCGMASIMGPALGRLLPPPVLIAAGVPVIAGLLSLFVIIGAVRDKIKYGKIHPAYLVGLAVQLAMWPVIDLVAKSSIGLSIYQNVVAGTPGAAQPGWEKAPFPG